MKIFNSLEEAEFESPPNFNSVERKRFFTLSAEFQEFLESPRTTPTNKVCFLVTLGYFKARRKFFARQFVQTDIEFVTHQVGAKLLEVSVENYDKATYLRHQRLILQHFGYQAFDEFARTFILSEIQSLVRAQHRPKLIFLETVQILTRKKIVIPTYNLLAKFIVDAINQHHQTLEETIEKSLSKSQCANLDSFLEKEANSDGDLGWRYQLTSFKAVSHSTRPAKIKENVSDLAALQVLYLEFKPIIVRLNLSAESIRHYAYLVIKSQVPQFLQRSIQVRYLYLIAFIAYQTFKLTDILTDTLLHSVQSVINLTQKNQKETYFQERAQRSQAFAQLQALLATIRQILGNTELDNQQKVSLIDTTLATETSSDVKKTLQNGQDDFDELETHSLKLQHRVAELIRHLHFDKNTSQPALLKALEYYQANNSTLDKNAPVTFLEAKERAALNNADGKFRISLYKMWLFIKTAQAIKSGAINLLHSAKYRSLEDYLIPKADWDAHREKYLEQANLTDFADCKATLNALEVKLEERYQNVNQRFKAGENQYLTLRKNGTAHVKTPKQETVESLSLGTFFPERKYISMLEMLATVNQATDFLSEFEHWPSKYQRTQPESKLLFAGIIGYGCDIGHRKLAQISSQLNENELENVVNWYFSLQNVQNANDKIVKFISQLELPKLYQVDDKPLHTSSDGQKIEVNVDSFNANHSFKYFGKTKGASVVTFIDSRDLMWYSTVISSAEREAAYVIDGLMHNDVVKSDIHSTDTHGYSEFVFGSTFFLGFEFAPRIKGQSKQKLVAFKLKSDYEKKGYVLLPDARVKEAMIENQWDEILRFIATIQMKIATASQLFKRLNSYSHQHSLYKALKEFGKIPKSLFLLKYRDDCVFRQSIEAQLNKVESSNKFSKAISFGNNQEFVQSEKEEQEIAESCRRLIKNAIVCWNYLYLTRELANEKNEVLKAELLAAIRNGSVVTWAHFNLHGEFDFSDGKMVDSVGLVSPKKKG
ncbi:MAG: Tn3 family transposase [Methylococcaceae bacterium]